MSIQTRLQRLEANAGPSIDDDQPQAAADYAEAYDRVMYCLYLIEQHSPMNFRCDAWILNRGVVTIDELTTARIDAAWADALECAQAAGASMLIALADLVENMPGELAGREAEAAQLRARAAELVDAGAPDLAAARTSGPALIAWDGQRHHAFTWRDVLAWAIANRAAWDAAQAQADEDHARGELAGWLTTTA